MPFLFFFKDCCLSPLIFFFFFFFWRGLVSLILDGCLLIWVYTKKFLLEMFFRSFLGRSWHASQTTADRLLVSHHHNRLIDSRYWDCTTPSKALSVLGLLVRSGTMIDKLDKAASEALSAMGPSMTMSEQALLGKWSSFLRLKISADGSSNTPQNVGSDICSTDINKSVVALYSLFIRNSQTSVLAGERSIVLSTDSVLRLDPISSLMLLEMMLSKSFQQGAAWRNENTAGALLTRLRYHVMYSKVIGFKALWWILHLLSNKESVLQGRSAESGRLFRACLRRLHDMLPGLTSGECLLLFPLLKNTLYDKPFIICADIIRRVVTCELEELSVVPTSVIMHTLECEDLVPQLRRRLYQLLCEDYRMGDIGKGECLFLLSIIAKSPDMEEAEKYNYEDDTGCILCESLFAQLYVTAKSMNAIECVQALEYMEVLAISHFSVTAPYDLLERIKKRIFSWTKQALKRPNLAVLELQCVVEAIHRLEGILRRSALLPFLADDAAVIGEIFRKLNYLLERPIEGNVA
ncbi:hypothetical protein MOQ_006551 [Trypanosoma cruzi marinkellei]|uniref:Uncharacterized protein n=1 Tax=Trypanosoma cruzi marinkellei TaxID=85056 RepID=K2MVF2_TRYCR|nr:hypothetical protein MOQ_006551 [Trypanosoma cruzi marinkellei]